MSDDILKQFMVAIGYKSDEASRKKAMEGVKQFEKAVVSLAEGLAAMAAAASAAALKVASSFEGLFYASQKAGASIQNLKGLSYAVSQLGGSYQGALASIEAFAKNLRTNPGYEGLVRSLGVATRQNGKLRETTDIFRDLGDVFRKQPYHVGFTYAQSLGLDEDTFRAIRDHGDQLKRFKEEYDRTARSLGVNQDDLGKRSADLMNSWRRLTSVLDVLAARIEEAFYPALKKTLDYLSETIIKYGPQIDFFWSNVGKGIEVVERGFKSAYAAAEPFFLDTAKWIQDWVKSDGFISYMKEVRQIFTDFAAALKVAYDYLAKMFALTSNSSAVLVLKSLFGSETRARVSDYTGAGGMPDWGAPSSALPGGKGALEPFRQSRIGRAVSKATGWITGNKTPSIRYGFQTGQGGKAGAATIGNWWTPDRQQYAIDRLKAGGVSELGAKALVARWSSVEARGGPASVNPNSGAFGIAQWLGSRKPSINGNTSFDDQIDYAIKELKTTEARALKTLNAAATAREAAIGAAQFERAEGWNGHTDNFAGQTEAAMAKIGRDAVRAAQSGRPIGQATNVSDEQVIANDHGHWSRLNNAIGKMDFSARHGATDAPLGVTNNSNADNRSTHSTFNVTQHIQGNGSAADTASATTRALTRFQEFSLRNAQGAVR